jgi:glycosyltransferase involved in cell wall biosynthesis
MKIAIVHDWLVTYAGAERVLEQMLLCFPEADLFAVVDFLDAEQRQHIQNKSVITTFIQKMPLARKKYRAYLPLMPLAIEQLDLAKYDLVISSSHAVAKGVLTGPDQLHISYVYSPMRYAWDLQQQYLREAGLEKGIRSGLARYILHKMRLWDLRTVPGVDEFLCVSRFIAKRIKKVYGREATVIYPPVDVDSFALKEEKEDFYLTASRMVPYKRIDLIVRAFLKMPQKQLIVIGDGPEMKKIKKLVGANVTLLGMQPFSVLLNYMQKAMAFVFAAEEDFGIAPLEAQACGTPVIAYGKGGCLETVNDLTGVFFAEQTEDSIIAAINRFEKSNIKAIDCRNNALRFSAERFRNEFKTFIEQSISSAVL